MSSAAYAWQNVPGRPGETVPQTSTAARGTPAPAGGQPPEPGFGPLLPLLIVVPMVIFLFLNSRSQQKKAQKMVDELKKGDRVLMQSGMVGKLLEMGDRYAKVEIAPGVKIEVVKSGLLGKDNPETAANVDQKK